LRAKILANDIAIEKPTTDIATASARRLGKTEKSGILGGSNLKTKH